MILQENIAPGGRPIERLIATEHGNVRILTAVHKTAHGRRQGGVRFVTRGSLEELAHLAHGMTEKAIAAAVAIDGMKTLVICEAGIPEDAAERARLLAEHVEQAISVDPYLVFGPDMGCREDVLDLVASKYGHLANVTGLTRPYGGLDIDTNALTAHGVLAAITTLNPEIGGTRVTIQGFGAVGAHTARGLADLGAEIIGISNVHGSYHSGTGLDASAMFRRWAKDGDEGLSAFQETGVSYDSDPNALLGVACDLFVPAARTSVLALANELPALRSENPDVRSTEEYLAQSGVRMIAEAANHPLSFAAEEFAHAKGVQVLPDVIINCGGMIGCCFEYDYRDELLGGSVVYDDALANCRDLIERTIRKNLEPAASVLTSARELRRLAGVAE